IQRLGSKHLGLREHTGIDSSLSFHYFAGCKVTVLLPLYERVLVDWWAEILVVVRCNLNILFMSGFRFAKLTRCRRQADLDRMRIALKHFRPLAPRRAVALINDDYTERILAVVFRQKARELLVVIIESERLVRSDVDAGILGRVLALLRLDDPGVVS